MSKKKEKYTRDISYPEQTIVNVDLNREMKRSYIDYAMSVIVGRALPDVRDGLKPVHRRILYTMYEEGITADKAFKKCATTVGAVLGSYHPHGDASVYDALVRLAQDFSMRYPLIEGHGNFGSIDGDPPAAYRYTEARMARISNEMLRDIEKETIDWTRNFDESKREPTVLPARFPCLLVNGSSGIAVGMTTNIPPHNLRETIAACLEVIDNPEADLNDLMQHIQGPDFPTRGIIVGKAGIRATYGTGRGRIKVRARTEIEEFGQNRQRIIVTELPYQVNKARLIESIADHVKNKVIEGISDLRDESDRDGLRIVIELKRDVNSQVVLNRLFATTQLQITFAAVMLALVNHQTQPKVLTLREILDEYLAFQKDVIRRRTEFDLNKAQERAHIVEGLRIAVDNIDEVIRTIRESYDNARENLMARFDLSDPQARAILELQLRRLQGLEREKLEAEYQELMEKIRYYQTILNDETVLVQVLREELQEISDKYGSDRLTEIEEVDDEIDIEDLIEEEDCCFTMSEAGYVKRMPASTYRAQRRGGRGVNGQNLKEEDLVKTLLIASSHDYLLFFTNRGRVHRCKGYQIPEAGRTARGTAIVNILPLEPEERVTTILTTRESSDDSLMMVTRQGTVKRLSLESIFTARKAGIRAITLDEGDELISVFKVGEDDKVLLATRGGMAICFAAADVRPMGRDATGVRGIRLAEDDAVIGAELYEEGKCLLTVTERGFGKRTRVEEYLRGSDENSGPQSRGGKGMKNYNITDKTGSVAGIRVVDDSDDVMMIESGGVIIRMPASDISIYSRSTQGVRVMRLDDDAVVIGVERADREPDEENTDAAEEPVYEADQPEENV